MTDVVVVGLGYVGLPLAKAVCEARINVTGFDVNQDVVDGLNAGVSHVDDLADRDVQALLDGGFRASSDEAVLARASTIVICVPTPLSRDGGPDLGPVRSAAEAVSRHIRPETLVILESTTWPGTTEEYVRPILERSGMTAGQDFALAFSPERIDPGNPDFTVRNTPKVVGGLTPGCGERAREFYENFVERTILAKGCKEAEMSKLLENTYRQVNIALVNEMAKFSHELGIDIWDVIECASSKPFGFQTFYPGPGVGGHCIPVDPSYLSHRVRAALGYPFRFVELAQEINRSMPAYVCRRIVDALNSRGLPLRGARVLLLGVTYKPGIADQRESPAKPLERFLTQGGAVVSFWDPFVQMWELDGRSYERPASLRVSAEEADLIVVLQPSKEYDSAFLQRVEAPVFDTSGSLQGSNVSRL